MPTKIGNNSDTFANIPRERCRPRSYIFAEDMWATVSGVEDGIINNQAVVYQSITGKQLDDSSAYGGNKQAHNGTTGALLGWPLCTFDFVDSAYTGAVNADRNIHRPTVFLDVLAASGTKARTLFRWPVFIPAGHSIVWVYIFADDKFEEMGPVLRHYTTAMAQEGFDVRNPNKYDMGGGVVAYQFPVRLTTPSQVYVMSLELDVTGVNTAQELQTQIYGGGVWPQYWEQWEGLAPQTEVASGDLDPEVGAAFQATWDTYTATGRPLSSYVTKRMAENDGFLHELVTGSPATGASAATTAGHIHDGTLLGGATIDMPLGGSALGWASQLSANAFGLIGDESEGDHGQAPHIDGNSEAEDTWYAMANTEIWVPTRTGTVTLNWAAVVMENDDYQGEAKLGIATTYGTWTYSTAQAFTGTGFKYVTGTITVTSATRHFIQVAMQCTGDGKALDTNGRISLCGFTLWLDA